MISRSKTRTKPYKRLNPVGKKGRVNAEVNVELKKRFSAMEIFRCELNYPGCMGTTMLSFAHAKKRRHFSEDGDWYDCLLACTPCHWQIEKLGEERMGDIIHAIIEARKV